MNHFGKRKVISIRTFVSSMLPAIRFTKITVSNALAALFAGTLILAVGVEGKPSLPVSHMIAGIPYHQQMNALSCGAGSLEMVFDYWGPEIAQKEIMNVARTSAMGTWPSDIVRTGHFSELSSAVGTFFPHAGPMAGFPERAMGYAAFGFSSDTFWLHQLKLLIAQDIPVIVLMNYSPTGGGGHYRVVMGYDDSQSRIYFIDTWGRDILLQSNWTGILSWTYSDFQLAWDYDEYGTPHPYFGAIVLPWSVNVQVKGKVQPGSTVKVTATITYPCPAPFDSSMFPASESFADINLPPGMSLVGSQQQVSLGTMDAGTSETVTWTVYVDEKVSGSQITVNAGGYISGYVPAADWKGQVVYYPEYEYTDVIGGSGVIDL